MRAIIADTETTGLKDSRPVEVAYIDVKGLFDDKAYLGYVYRKLFNPLKPIEFGAMATHHITNEDVAECEPYTAFKLPPDVDYLIGHNIDFDWQVMQACGEQPQPKRICTLAIARYLYPEIDSHKLTAMLYALDMPYALQQARKAHNALDDVVMTRHLLAIMLPKTGAKNLEELYQFSEMARIPKTIKFGKHSGQSIESLPSDYKQWLLKQNDLDPYLRKALTQT